MEGRGRDKGMGISWYRIALGLFGLILCACAPQNSGGAPSITLRPTPTLLTLSQTTIPDPAASARQPANQARADAVRKRLADANAGLTEFPARFYALRDANVYDDILDVRTSLPETAEGQAMARELCRDFVAIVDEPAQLELRLEYVGVLSEQGRLLAVRRVRGDEC
jgi:hypothetical protein